MWTDWKIDMAMVDSMGDPLNNVMYSLGTDSVMGWNIVCYTGFIIFVYLKDGRVTCLIGLMKRERPL